MAENGLKVTVLGSGTCVPRLLRAASSVLLSFGRERILLDTGPGAMRRLLEAGSHPGEITALFYSHLHPDHTAELAPFLFSAKYPPGLRRQKPFVVVAARGFGAFYENLQKAYGSWIVLDDGLMRILEMDCLGPDSLELPAYTVRSCPVRHTPHSLAFRITTPSGVSVVYSGDTDFSEELIALAQGADLFLCESSMPDGMKVEGHLTPSLAGRMAAGAGVKRLVLTHLYPEADAVDLAAQCRQTWHGPLDVAQDLMEFRL